MRLTRTITLKILLLMFMIAGVVPVLAPPTMRIDVFLFHTETCPACAQMIEFLDTSFEDYPTMVVQKFDIRDEENKVLYDLFKEVYELDIEGYPVPMVFIGKDSFGGYSAVNLKLMDKKLEGCLRQGCTIALTLEQDTIVIIDPTQTPELPIAEFLAPFLVLAGVFCCLNPYNAEIVSKLETWKSLFFFPAYVVTSLLLCFALFNVVFILETVIFLKVPLVALAVLLGVLSMISAKVKGLRVPQSVAHAMDQLAADKSGFSFFSLGIGACIVSLLYTCGIYLLVVYRMLFSSFSDRLVNFAVFNVTLLAVLILLYVVNPGKRTLFYGVVGIGSIVLGIFFWMVG